MKKKTALGVFARYCTLSVLAMFGASCYVLADTYFVSKGMGLHGLTALNLSIPAFGFIQGLGLLIGVGGAIKYTIFRSHGETEKMDQMYSQSMLICFAASLVFFLLGLTAAKPLAVLLGADGEVLEMTTTYLRVLLLFAPAMVVSHALQCFLRNDGAPFLVTVALLVSNFANIVLDYVFIFPMQMGIFGAIFATGLSPVIAISIMLVHFRKNRGTLRFRWVRVNRNMLWEALGLGVPSLIAQVSSGVVILVFNMLILGLEGNTGVAAYGVVANLAIVVLCVLNGVAQGVQPLLTQCYGNGDTGGLRRMLTYSCATVVVFSGLVYFAAYTGAQPLAAIFNEENSAAMEALAVHGIRLYFLYTLPAGINLVLSTYFTSIEKTRPAQWLSLLRGFLLILPLAYLLAELGGMTGVWLACPITEAVVMALGGWVYFKHRRTE